MDNPINEVETTNLSLVKKKTIKTYHTVKYRSVLQCAKEKSTGGMRFD